MRSQGRLSGPYVEPERGSRLVVRNGRMTKRLLGKDAYCVTAMSIDGREVFRDSKCRIKHGADFTVHVADGRHAVDLVLEPEWGSEPGVMPEKASAMFEAKGEDLALSIGEAGAVSVAGLEAFGAAQPQ